MYKLVVIVISYREVDCCVLLVPSAAPLNVTVDVISSTVSKTLAYRTTITIPGTFECFCHVV